METVRGQGGGLRGGQGGKKMKKRKELDALVGGGGIKRGNGSHKRSGRGGVSPQDQLLSESTGEDDYWSTAKGNGTSKRHCRSNPGKRGISACTTLLRLCSIFLTTACVVATVTVMWLFIDIKEQTTYLRSQLDQVSAGSESIPEAIQKCHSLTKQLELNQTKIIQELHQVALKLTNFTVMITEIRSGLTKLQNTVVDTPELVNIPHDIQTLASTVAKFGSLISDLQITSNQIKEEHQQINSTIDKVVRNQTSIENEIRELKKGSGKNNVKEEQLCEKVFERVMDKVEPDISSINSSLWFHLDHSSKDQFNNHKDIEDLKDKSAQLNSWVSTLRNEQKSLQVENTKTVEDLKKQSENISEEFYNLKADTLNMIGDMMSQIQSLKTPLSVYNNSKVNSLEFLRSDLSKNLTDTNNCKNCISHMKQINSSAKSFAYTTNSASEMKDMSSFMLPEDYPSTVLSSKKDTEFSHTTLSTIKSLNNSDVKSLKK